MLVRIPLAVRFCPILPSPRYKRFRMPTQRYSYTAITLHWLIALLLAFQIALGWALEGNNSPELFARYQLHKSIGISILLLSLARLAVRLFTKRPPASDGPAWTRMLAGIVHWLFYLVMILGQIGSASCRERVCQYV